MDDKQLQRAMDALRYWHEHGDPIKVRDIRRALEAGEMPSNDLLNTTAIRPTAEDVDVEEIEIPARAGEGSGVRKWREFAKATTDMDTELIDAMSKEDLIAELEATGVIPAEEE